MKTSIHTLAAAALIALTSTSHAAEESSITLNTSGKAIPITSVAEFGKASLAAINKAIDDPTKRNETTVCEKTVDKSIFTTRCVTWLKKPSREMSRDQIGLLKANLERAIKSAEASKKSISDIGKGSIENSVFVGKFNLDLLAGIKTTEPSKTEIKK